MHMVIKNVRRYLLETIKLINPKISDLTRYFISIFLVGGGGGGKGRGMQEKGIDVSTMQKGVIVYKCLNTFVSHCG